MRIVVTQDALRLSRRILFGSAFSLLGYCGVVLANSWIFQGRESLKFDRLVRENPKKRVSGAPLENGALIGRFEIPRLGVSVILIEGTSAATLERAVGHIAGTSQPGQAGNVGISGHRDTFFRPLRNIQESDLITVTTLNGKFTYRVVSTRVVDPAEVSVLDASNGEILTLVTCYPFYFVGPAPDRFIVKAERLL